MHCLFICDTYSQVFAAIQMKRTLLKTEEVDMIMVDEPYNAEKITAGLKQINLFNRVAYVKCHKEENLDRNVRRIVRYARGIWYTLLFCIGYREVYKKQIWSDRIDYDAIYYVDLRRIVFYIVEEVEKKRDTPRTIILDEGVLGYNNAGNLKGMTADLYKRVRKILRKVDFTENQACAVFYPDIYKMNPGLCEEIIPIPSVKGDKEFYSIIGQLFGMNEMSNPAGDYKYIYFGLNGNADLGEIELVEKLAVHIGKEKLLIKKHPGDHRTYFEKNGYHIMPSSYVPWEAYLSAFDFSGKCFISICSTSILNSSLMFDSGASLYYLYPCINEVKLSRASNIVKVIEEFDLIRRSGYCKDINVTSNIEDISVF